MDDSFILCGEPDSQRAEQKEHTRVLILAAAIALVTAGGEDALSMRAVAGTVGISERTVHRHFETRDDLATAAWRALGEEFIGRQELPRSAEELAEMPRKLFPRLSKHRDFVRAYLYSKLRWKTRRRVDLERQKRLIACTQQELEYMDDDALRRRAAIIDVISNPYTCELLQERWDLSGEDAAAAAMEAIEILLNRRLAY